MRKLNAWERYHDLPKFQGRISPGLEAQVASLVAQAGLPGVVAWPEGTTFSHSGQGENTKTVGHLDGFALGAYDSQYPDHKEILSIKWSPQVGRDGTVWVMPMSRPSSPSTSLENFYNEDTGIAPRAVGTIELFQLVPDSVIEAIMPWADQREREAKRVWGTREEADAIRQTVLSAFGVETPMAQTV